MTIPNQDLLHIFERLREGTVPERGLSAFAVGVDRPMGEIKRILDLTRQGEGINFSGGVMAAEKLFFLS